MDLPVTTYQTINYEITFGKRVCHLEAWVVDDHFWLALIDSMHAWACLLTLEQVRDLGMSGNLKNEKADCVAVIKKSAADMACDEDLQHLARHEGAHWLAGHAGKTSSLETEKEVAKMVGVESEEWCHLFGLRYLHAQGVRIPDGYSLSAGPVPIDRRF